MLRFLSMNAALMAAVIAGTWLFVACLAPPAAPTPPPEPPIVVLPTATARAPRAEATPQTGVAYPNPAITPGAVFATATAAQVCKPGYARAVRNVTAQEKAAVFAAYHTVDVPGMYEVDHLISLELGGSNDLHNLWPQPYAPAPGAHEKDRVENYLHGQVCSGKLDLAEAQQEIASDWYAVFTRCTC